MSFISVLDYLTYDGNENFVLESDEVLVSRNFEETLNFCASRGVFLVYDNCKSQGLYIMQGEELLGHVTVFMNEKWLSELLTILKNYQASRNK